MASPEKNKLAKPKAGPPTQQYLDIAEIRDDLVVMKDGTVRGILLVGSINFALKSEEEQVATIQSYMTFLNSLEYNIQIVIQSRKMNIDAYLEALKIRRKETGNDLLRTQIDDYVNFIQELVVLGEIMQKRFYVVVPYDPATNKQKKFFSRMSEVLSPATAAKLSQKQFTERKDQLDRRVQIIQGQIASMGLQVLRLDTQALIELYYTAYNPDIFESERLDDVSKIGVEQA